MDILISVGLFVLGAVMGSFACCRVWRMRTGDKSRWSHCMECGVRLQARDNVPVVSWVVLRGRCRKCRKFIGWAEILSEVVMGVLFVVAYWLWPFGFCEWWGWAGFFVFLVLLVGLCILFIYDLRWLELPQVVLTFCVICASIFLGLKIGRLVSGGQFSWGDLWGLAGALVILPGLYFVLYKVSREGWMGGGDWWVALVAALVLGDWWLAVVCTFVGNFLGSVIGLVLIKRCKGDRGMRLAFGPFLVVGMLVVFFAQEWLMGLI